MSIDQGPRSPRRTTIPTCGSRRSMVRERWRGSTSRKRYAGTVRPGRLRRRSRTLAAIFDRPDNIPFVARLGRHLYNFWKDAEHRRGLWRRTTLESFRTEQPKWETSWISTPGGEEAEDWVWGGVTTLPGSHDRAILSLSRGGGDAAVLREFDRRQGLRGTASSCRKPRAGPGSTRTRCCCRAPMARHGDQHPVIRGPYDCGARRRCRAGAGAVRVDAGNHVVGAGRPNSPGERVWFVDKPAFFDAITWMGDRTGPKVKLDLPTDIWMERIGDGWR